MKKWFRFMHQVCILIAIGVCMTGASVAFTLAKWESQDYSLVCIATLIIAGIFKGMSDGAPEAVLIEGADVGKDSKVQASLPQY
jgi:hypothetical protein